MARDNSPQVRQRAQLERKQSKRASYDRILIVSEGSKTEPLYFKEIRSTLRLHTANVEVQPSALGTEPMQVVRYAQKLFEKGDPFKRVRPRAFEQVFAVFDRDDHLTYFDALASAAALDGRLRNELNKPVKFKAIASVPCFELWLLLHFEDVQHPMHRTAVLARLKNYIPGYEKGGASYFATTKAHLEIANQRAKALAALSTAFDDDEPSTDIFELVELLIGFSMTLRAPKNPRVDDDILAAHATPMSRSKTE